jgi:hypothetical protein
MLAELHLSLPSPEERLSAKRAVASLKEARRAETETKVRPHYDTRGCQLNLRAGVVSGRGRGGVGGTPPW